MNRLGRACLVTVLLCWPAANLIAQQKLTELVMPAMLNSTAAGEFKVILTADGDILIRADDLRRAGLTGDRAERLLRLAGLGSLPRTEETVGYVSVASLAPLITASIDEATLGLVVTANPTLFSTTRLDSDALRPGNITYSKDPSAFLNYAVTSTGTRTPSFAGEFGTSLSGTLLYSSFTRSGNEFHRGSTNYTIDQPTQRRRWVLGDSGVSTGDILGGNATLAGLTVATNYSIDPYFIRQSTAVLTGNALNPSTVTVYVNGVRVSERQVPPGEFELRGVPLPAGAGQVTIVVRDAFGREVTQTGSFYSSNTALAAGLSEYAYSVGKLRDATNSAWGEYGDTAFIARHRYGFSRRFTGGLRAEGTTSLWSVGPNFVLSTPYGDVSGSGGASSDHGSRGEAGSIRYDRLTRRLSFGGQYTWISPDYATLSLARAANRPSNQTAAYIGYAFPRASLTVLYAKSTMRDTGGTKNVTLTGNVPLSNRVALGASGGWIRDASGDRKEFSAGVSIYLGRNVSVAANVGQRNGITESNVELQQPMPTGTGFGYRVRSTSSLGSTVGDVNLQYQGRYGRYEVAADTLRTSDPSFGISGGVILQSGRIALSRAVQDSFALVRVPGIAGVRVYSANQLIGKTDGRGDLIVPSLLSYYANDLTIDDRDIPVDYTIEKVFNRIAPPYRGGALAVFPVVRMRSVVGRIVVSAGGNQVTPEYGQLTVSRNGVTQVSPLGRTGEFYLENVSSGGWSGKVEWAGGECRFTLDVPESKGAVTDMSVVTCNMEGRAR